jgi:hypothetical protein
MKCISAENGNTLEPSTGCVPKYMYYVHGIGSVRAYERYTKRILCLDGWHHGRSSSIYKIDLCIILYLPEDIIQISKPIVSSITTATITIEGRDIAICAYGVFISARGSCIASGGWLPLSHKM